MMQYMNKFKTLLDTSTQGELDHLTATYDGFYEFSLFLENFASAIQNGAFDDHL